MALVILSLATGFLSYFRGRWHQMETKQLFLCPFWSRPFNGWMLIWPTIIDSVMVRERQIQREKTETDSKGGMGRGGMEGDDWSVWHPANREVLCASGPLWNRLLLYRMEQVLELQKVVGGDLLGIHAPTIHLRTEYPVPMGHKLRFTGKGY